MASSSTAVVAPVPAEPMLVCKRPAMSIEEMQAAMKKLKDIIDGPYLDQTWTSPLPIEDAKSDEELRRSVGYLGGISELVRCKAREGFVEYVTRKAEQFVEAGSGKRFSDVLADKGECLLTYEDVCTLLHGHPIRRCRRSYMLVPIDESVQFLTDAAYDALEDLSCMLERVHHEMDGRCGMWDEI
jgi:hypothetical protein